MIAHVPVRAAIGAGQCAVVLVIAAALGVRGLGALAATLAIGCAMVLSFGYLLAARLTTPDVTLQLAFLVPVLVLATSGAVMPLEVYPPALAAVFGGLPTTWLVATLNAQVVGVEGPLPIEVAWMLMAGVTLLAALAAAALFRWERVT